MLNADQRGFGDLAGDARVEFRALMVRCALDAAEPRHLANLGDPGDIAPVCAALHEWLEGVRQGGPDADAQILRESRVAYDLVTGDEVDPVPAGDGRRGTDPSLDDPSGLHQVEAVAAGVVYRARDGVLDARDTLTGSLLWQVPLGDLVPAGHQVHRMVPAPERLFVLTGRNVLLCLADEGGPVP